MPEKSDNCIIILPLNQILSFLCCEPVVFTGLESPVNSSFMLDVIDTIEHPQDAHQRFADFVAV
jgi:hypothetical protein